jgi:hypothetical protein
MSKLLRGNYKLAGRTPTAGEESAAPKVEPASDAITEFERRALERLGGSIAFVLKKSTLVWRGDEGSRADGRPPAAGS